MRRMIILVMSVAVLLASHWLASGDELQPGLNFSGRQDALQGKAKYPESLRGQTKHYALSRMGNMCDNNFDRPVPLPATLEPGRRRTFRLPMCAEPTDRGLELTIQVVVQKTSDLPRIGVSFNGRWPNDDGQATDRLLFPSKPKRHVSEQQAYNYRFGVNEIIEGWNEITLTNSGGQPTRIVGLELAVQ